MVAPVLPASGSTRRRTAGIGPSPAWVQARLRAVGLRPISALVDVTNLISLDRARPLHVFDAAKLTGDLTAHSLGVAPEKLRQQTFLVCAMATACFVATSGVIGFIGLMVPHLVRHWTGPLHRKAFLPTLLIGAALLVGSDLLSRILLAPQELPVGVITAGVGAIFVMRIVLRNSL